MTHDLFATRHLTQEVLLGEHRPDLETHLAACPSCRSQVKEFRSTMSLFNQASLAWSEAKSNSLNRDLREHRTPFRMSARAVWTSASVAVLLLAGLVGTRLQHHPETLSASSPTVSQPSLTADSDASRDNEIASDNAMLQQIDAAINTPEPSPQELYGAAGTASLHGAHPGQVRD
jgi:anti-sigma factor RsiW